MSKFEELVVRLRDQFPLDPSILLDTKDIDHEALLELLKSYTTNDAEWSSFALFDPSKNYSRNGIEDFGPNGNLLILVWMPGKSSFIHDHSNAHCCMKVLGGKLKESLYRLPESQKEGTPVLFRETVLGADEVTYINDSMGIHKISNPTDKIAISLHLYTPPYAKLNGCNYYESSNGKRHHCDMSKLYSWRGEIIPENLKQAASVS